MPYDTIDPLKTGVMFFDLLNYGFRGADEATQRRMEPIVANCVRLRAVADERGMPVFFPKADHRPDGKDAAPRYTDTNVRLVPWADPEREPFRQRRANVAESWEAAIIDELKPTAEDYVVAKHRWNAFFQTKLDLSLRTCGIETVVVCGGATEIGVASTVFGARDLDYGLVIVRDACSSSRFEVHDMLMDQVFPRMARVRTTDEVIAMVHAGAARGG